MKIGITSDWHWSQFSSIVRQMGKKYSVRLEHLVDSVNWAERLFVENGCYAHVCLGDTFDTPELNSQEITALRDVKWGKLFHYFIVGNHDMSSSDLSENVTNLFSLMPMCEIISSPTMCVFENIRVFMLPYILESNRKPLSEYLQDYDFKPDVILSHNDVSGSFLNDSGAVSTTGFSIEEIKENCGLFLNGHIHAMGKISDGMYNVGNLCGQNFGENAFNRDHCAWIIDTQSGEIQTFVNPYAFNFFKIDFTDDSDIDTINEVSRKLKHNSVVTIKCKESDYDYLRARFGTEPNDLFPHNCNVLSSRFIVDFQKGESQTEHNNVQLSVDHLLQFERYIKQTLGRSDLLEEELMEVLK